MTIVVNGIKYSCGTCIRGHRTSSCNHQDRQLFEVRKKGRPPSNQCRGCKRKPNTTSLSTSSSLESPDAPCTCMNCVDTRGVSAGVKRSSLEGLGYLPSKMQRTLPPYARPDIACGCGQPHLAGHSLPPPPAQMHHPMYSASYPMSYGMYSSPPVGMYPHHRTPFHLPPPMPMRPNRPYGYGPPPPFTSDGLHVYTQPIPLPLVKPLHESLPAIRHASSLAPLLNSEESVIYVESTSHCTDTKSCCGKVDDCSCSSWEQVGIVGACDSGQSCPCISSQGNCCKKEASLP